MYKNLDRSSFCLARKIETYAKAIEENSNSARQILRAVECFLLIRQINSMFHESVKNCEGCQIDDPSQKKSYGRFRLLSSMGEYCRGILGTN